MNRARRTALLFSPFLLAGCLNTGVLPTPLHEEGPVDRVVGMVVGGEPFRPDQACQEHRAVHDGEKLRDRHQIVG